MPIDRRMDKDDVVYVDTHTHTHTHTHTQNGILLSHKKELSIAICSYMDESGENYTKWSTSGRERQISWYHLFVESKKTIQMSLFTKQKQTHRHRKQSYGYQRGKGAGEG